MNDQPNMPESPCLPVLYSFRRCPYAMRARMAIAEAGISVELREVLLRDKPQALLEASPKATVPVLVLQDGSVIEESFEILLWAFSINDPDGWLQDKGADLAEMVTQNDGEFKQNLDGYKYPQRNTEKTRSAYRDDGASWLGVLDDRLQSSDYLAGDTPSALDIAIMPFIRQFAHTDLAWFESSPYLSLNRWLSAWKNSELFLSVMHKSPQWQPGDPPQVFS
jgi:glutathione S-transferase